MGWLLFYNLTFAEAVVRRCSSKYILLKNYKFHWKAHVLVSLFKRVAGPLLNRDSNTGAFLWNLRNFLKHLRWLFLHLGHRHKVWWRYWKVRGTSKVCLKLNQLSIFAKIFIFDVQLGSECASVLTYSTLNHLTYSTDFMNSLECSKIVDSNIRLKTKRTGKVKRNMLFTHV